MPFAKLFSAVFGKSQPTKPSQPKRTRSRGGRSGKMAQPTTTTGQPEAAAKPAKRSVLDLVCGGPHASLCRLVKKSSATSVLEIGVEDGTRAAAVLATLTKSRSESELKYIAVDLFEMGDGPVTLKDFHQQIRATGITPKVTD